MRIATLLAVLLLPAGLSAELQPEQIAIIAVRASKESRELAEYYAEARKIPKEHICLIDVKPASGLSREKWEGFVRPSIRQWIAEHNLQEQLKCFVTVWDVPLKIGRADANRPEIRDRTLYLEAERNLRVDRMNRLIEQMDGLLAKDKDDGSDDEGDEDKDSPSESGEEEPPELQDLTARFDDSFKRARARLQPLQGTPAAGDANAVLGRVLVAGGGVGALFKNIDSQIKKADDQSDPKIQQATIALNRYRGQLEGLQQGLSALHKIPESVERDQQILALLERSNGLVGSLRWIDEQLTLLKKNESAASFDSELSLLYWPDYPLIRWQSNVLHHRFDNSDTRWLRATLMVARIEAPTFELSKKLIDTAIAVEKEGLAGQFYLDARGMKQPSEPVKRGSYGEYDQAIRDLAEMLEKHSDQPRTLDNTNKLFQPGDCPEAALYCGWYSLANYIDAFEWNPGAVAYHIASGEAVTLRKPDSNVWCKRMLEEGVCATLGPTFEPYLAAFPRPDEFFTVLLSGRYTLVECYYRTKPFNSWAMVLVGDPLYNPFRGRSPLKVDQLPENLRSVLEEEPRRSIPGRDRRLGMHEEPIPPHHPAVAVTR